MVTLGTPLSPHAFRVLLLGSGELGKEVAIELQRFGVELVAADRYADAPAMQVAHHSHVLDMLDGAAVRTSDWPLPDDDMTGLTTHGRPIRSIAAR